MKIKIVAIIIAILVLPGITIACLNTVENTTESSEFATNVEDKKVSTKTNDNEIIPTNYPIDNLEITVTTDHNMYRWIFEPVEITISIENQGEEDKTLTFPSSKNCDFIIRKGLRRKIPNLLLYQWSLDKFFQQGFEYVTIPAGETWSQTLTWRQIGTFLFSRLHYKVLPGTYYITGQIPTIDRTYTDTVQIKIVPSIIYRICR